VFCTLFSVEPDKSAPWNPVKNLNRTLCLAIPELGYTPHISPFHLFQFQVGGHENFVWKVEDRTGDRSQMAANIRTRKEV
jgi:hypothetical protein